MKKMIYNLFGALFVICTIAAATYLLLSYLGVIDHRYEPCELYSRAKSRFVARG